jgi:hypothetical protein
MGIDDGLQSTADQREGQHDEDDSELVAGSTTGRRWNGSTLEGVLQHSPS